MDINIPKVNVNIGIYIVSLISIGFGEKFQLTTLYWAGCISGLASLISILWCLPSYTRNYVKDKNQHENRIQGKKIGTTNT